MSGDFPFTPETCKALVEQLLKNIEAKSKECKELEAKIESITKKHNDAYNEINENYADKSHKILELKVEIQHLRDRIIPDREIQINNLKQENDKLKQQIEELTKEYNELSKTYGEKYDEVHKLNIRINVLNLEIQELKDEIKKLKSQDNKDKLTSQLQEVMDDNVILAQSNKDHKKAIEDMIICRQKIIDKNSELTIENNKLKQQIEVLTKEKQELETKKEEAEKEKQQEDQKADNDIEFIAAGSKHTPIDYSLSEIPKHYEKLSLLHSLDKTGILFNYKRSYDNSIHATFEDSNISLHHIMDIKNDKAVPNDFMPIMKEYLKDVNAKIKFYQYKNSFYIVCPQFVYDTYIVPFCYYMDFSGPDTYANHMNKFINSNTNIILTKHAEDLLVELDIKNMDPDIITDIKKAIMKKFSSYFTITYDFPQQRMVPMVKPDMVDDFVKKLIHKDTIIKTNEIKVVYSLNCNLYE